MLDHIFPEPKTYSREFATKVLRHIVVSRILHRQGSAKPSIRRSRVVDARRTDAPLICIDF